MKAAFTSQMAIVTKYTGNSNPTIAAAAAKAKTAGDAYKTAADADDASIAALKKVRAKAIKDAKAAQQLAANTANTKYRDDLAALTTTSTEKWKEFTTDVSDLKKEYSKTF